VLTTAKERRFASDNDGNILMDYCIKEGRSKSSAAKRFKANLPFIVVVLALQLRQ